MGYMTSQRQKMLGQKTGTNRPALISTYGYDTKFAGHMIRLGLQGIEFLETGAITLPMPDAETVREIRGGHWLLDDIMALASNIEGRLEHAYKTTSLPETPNDQWLNNWLIEHYMRAYFG